MWTVGVQIWSVFLYQCLSVHASRRLDMSDMVIEPIRVWPVGRRINFRNQRRPLSLHCFHTSLNHCHLWPGSWSSFSTFIHCSHFLLLSPHRRQSDILAIFFFFKGKWSVIFFSFFKLINFLFLSALGLVTVRAFSLVMVSRDYSPVAVQRPVIAVTSLIAEHGL